jgi:hypothetical protein
VAAEIAEPGGLGGTDVPFGARLAAAEEAVTSLAEAADDLGQVADEDLTGVMGELTTLVGRLDALRVAVTTQVRERDVFRRQGATSVTAWLRADVRTADVAASLAHLSARASEMPKITALLAAGQVSLAQAGTACWQIAHLPEGPRPPDTVGEPAPPPDSGPEPSASIDDGPQDELWAGLWRHGDVHAAADELFSRFMPRLDSDRLRSLGAHLREAADAQERATEDYSAYARRYLRLSRGFGGVGELSGRLHPEAVDQVLAALAELGAKAGPDDPRTKPQRWADALVYLTGLAGLTTPAPEPTPPPPNPETSSSPASNPSPPSSSSPQSDPGPQSGPQSDSGTQASSSAQSGPGTQARPDAGAEPDDDQPSPDGGHGHGSSSSSGHSHPTAPGRPQPVAGAAGVAPSGLRRPRVIVTVPLSTLLGQPLSPGAVLGAGTPITGEAARRLACDADLVRLVTGPPGLHAGCLRPSGADTHPPGTDCGQAHSTDPGSPEAQSRPPGGGLGARPGRGARPGHGGGAPPGKQATGVERDATGQLTEVLAGVISGLPWPLGGPSAVLDIGRRSQSWTPRQRDALYGQYGGRCGAPGCRRGIDVLHHIVHWAHGGATTVANGAPFCLFHHWLVHEGGWRVAKGPDGGLVLIAPPPGWQPGTIYRHGKPVRETAPDTDAP